MFYNDVFQIFELWTEEHPMTFILRMITNIEQGGELMYATEYRMAEITLDTKPSYGAFMDFIRDIISKEVTNRDPDVKYMVKVETGDGYCFIKGNSDRIRTCYGGCVTFSE